MKNENEHGLNWFNGYILFQEFENWQLIIIYSENIENDENNEIFLETKTRKTPLMGLSLLAEYERY